MTDPTTPPNDTIIIGNRYRVDGQLGVGGMATVYLGTDIESQEQVAIKLLKQDVIDSEPNIVQRFKREGEALSRLNHPNIVTMLDAISEGGREYVVMEYVSGGDLRDLIDSRRRESTMIPIEQVLSISLDIADALTRAHHLKIIHRDIKPDNVLLTADGSPRLTDFGVARIDGASNMTRTGALIGTLAYLSPEICMGDPIDLRSDLWSFGIMMYELLTLRLPYISNNPAAVLNAIMTKKPDSLTKLRPDAPPALITLVESMLVKDREQRIRSARQVATRLEAIITDGDHLS